jgi:hypothetical protein
MCRLSKRMVLSLLIAMSLLAVALPACQSTTPANPTPSPTMTIPPFTQIVKEILADPGQFEGLSVTLVGYYRGWDLLAEAGSAPPVTRSDWVLKDDSGAIYVQSGLVVEGDISLNPSSKTDTDKVLRVTGFVRVTDAGQPYIEPELIELMK